MHALTQICHGGDNSMDDMDFMFFFAREEERTHTYGKPEELCDPWSVPVIIYHDTDKAEEHRTAEGII